MVKVRVRAIALGLRLRVRVWVRAHVQTAAGSCGIHGSHALRMGRSPTWGRGRGRGRFRGRV